MRKLTAARTRQVRAAAQGLGGRAGTVEEAVRKVVALQAQDVRANRLAVRVRSTGLTAADVDAACRDRRVVRTWAMRGTLHMLAADDFGWVTGLLGPHFAARGAPRRRRLGLDEATLERAKAGLDAVLATPLTRAEIVARLADHGTVLDPRSQAPAHLLGYAALTGQVCRGPDTDKDEATYVLVRNWLGPREPLGEEEALARLAERYLAGHGPATAADLAAWSGLPTGRAEAGLTAVGTERVEAAGVVAHVLGDQPDEPPAPTRLLGHFDAYLLGYRGRALAVPAAHASAIQAGGGFVMPAVVVAGRVVGTWRFMSTKDPARVELTPFGASRPPDVGNELADLARFLRRRVVLGT